MLICTFKEYISAPCFILAKVALHDSHKFRPTVHQLSETIIFNYIFFLYYVLQRSLLIQTAHPHFHSYYSKVIDRKINKWQESFYVSTISESTVNG